MTRADISRPTRIRSPELISVTRAWLRGIYAGEEPVCFVILYADPEESRTFWWRLMVDLRHQKEGSGFEAMQQLIEYVKALSGASVLETSYRPGEGDPSSFCRKPGFEETGELLAGKRVLKMPL